LLFFATACALYAQSTLISVPTRRDMVFDRAGKYLYISTSDGWVRRYNLSTGQLESGYNLGGKLNGMDIAPDDSFLLVAQDVVSGAQGIFHRLDLNTGSVTNITYNRDFSEAGAWDVAIGSNGIALATTRLPDFYSGSTPLRQIDLTTNLAAIRSDVPSSGGPHEVYDTTQIYRSADRTRLYFLEAGISNGPVFTYDATTDSFGPLVLAQMYFDTATGAVNRNGTLLSTLVGVQYPFGYSKPKVAVDSAPALHFLRGFSEPDSGLAFDAVTDILYAVSSSAEQIIAYDTTTFAEKFRLNIGETVQNMVTQFGPGTLVASQDGRYLALATSSGIRLFSVAAATPSAPPAPSFTTRRDLIFDHSGQYLYLTTDNGLVERFHLINRTLEIVVDLGGKLNGADIAPDDSFLLVAQDNYGVAEGMWQKVDLVTGQVTNINYVRDFSAEAGAWDVAIASNGFAFLTTTIPDGFSSFTPLRQLNLATNALTIRSDTPDMTFKPTAGTHISRSADYTRLLFLEPNTSNGPLFTYSAISNTFGPLGQSYSFLDSSSAAVNRNGALIASRRGYPNHASIDSAPDLHFVAPLPVDGGVAFDALRDTVYGVDRVRSEVIAFDTNTGGEKYRFAIGENVSPPLPMPGGPGPYTPEIGYIKLVASNDGRYLALETPLGFRIVDLLSVTHTSPPEPIFGAIRSMVFDHSGSYLYVTTATGFVWPYNLGTRKLEIPYNLGGSLAGIDIAPDDSCLVVAQEATGVSEGFFEKIRLSDGAITRINYKPVYNGSEIGWDVAIAANGLGFGTTSGQGLYQIDLANSVATRRTDFSGFYGQGLLSGLTKIRRSADAQKFLFEDDYANIFFYTSSSDSFGPASKLDIGFNPSLALNRDGSLMAVRFNNTNLMTIPGLSTTHSFNDLTHAIVFDAAKDVLYGVNTTTDEIVGYDSSTFTEQVRFPIGEDVVYIPQPQEFRNGAFASSPNGRYLALQCDAALRVFDLSTKSASPIPTLPRIGNISTRAFVGTGDNIPIAGFIVTGSEPKKVVIRAIGPSLTAAGISSALLDPFLELHDASGAVIAVNDNWKDSQENEIRLSGLAPANDSEAVLVRTLFPGTYTAVMRGANNGTGIGLAEVYDTEPNTVSKLANISTRGFIGTGEQLMIAGIIVRSVGYDGLTPAKQLLVRGLGPSLTQFNVPNALGDPILEIHDSNGTTTGINDDWKIPQETNIKATGLAPSNDRESAMFLTLSPGNFTALLRGKGNTTGAGLIEVFALP
jgi:WD40 repeat protein